MASLGSALKASGQDADDSSSTAEEIGKDARAEDSDFGSSDLDEVLMSMGRQHEGCESARTARVWGQRAHNKRKRHKAQAADASDSSGEEPAEKRQAGGSSGSRPSTGAQRARTSGGLPALLGDDVRAALVRGQAQFASGDFEQAIASMHAVIQMEPGLPDPFHVLTLIYKERGEAKKALDAMLMAAYFTPAAEGRLLWRRVATDAHQMGLIDQACYAYRRSIGGKGAKTAEELESMWELAQLLFKKGRLDEGIIQLYGIYTATGEDSIAVEAAKKLVYRCRWRECLELLGDCVARGRRSQRGVDLNTLNMYCEVLMEVRDFAKCADLLIDVLKLRVVDSEQGASSSASTAEMALSLEELTAKMLKQPVDLVAKLAVARCHLRKPDSLEAEPICSCAIEVVLLQPADDHSDLYLAVVDALLANESLEESRLEACRAGRKRTCQWPARYAQRILDILTEHSLLDDEIKERRAKCFLQLGNAKDAALILEHVIELPGARTDAQLRELHIRVAEAWYECGQPERADKYIDFLSFDDLQTHNLLPHAMSSEQRRTQYKHLNELADRLAESITSSAAKRLDWDDLQDFAQRSRQLVLDCELDYTRLARYSQQHGSSDAQSSVLEEDQATPACNGANHDSPSEPTAGTSPPRDVDGVLANPDDVVVDKSATSGIVAVRGLENKSHELQVMDKPSSIYKIRRRHLGFESIEDLFGFEAYIAFILKALSLLQACRFAEEKGAGLRKRTVEVTRMVDVCEMVLTNRKLVAMRNPVKRRMLRELAQKSMTMAFEARLWRIVFKHLRLMCDASVDEGPLALFARVLFTHAELHLPSRQPSRNGGEFLWDKLHQESSGNAQRNTYAASLVDVRSWALRQLLRKPKSYGFTLLSGHFCVAASQYSLAVAEYCRAHRLAPFDGLTCLCLGVAYLSFAMSRTALHRHGLILKGFAFLQRYRRLRLEGSPGVAEASASVAVDADARSGEARAGTSVPVTAVQGMILRAEAEYNYGRGFHQLGIYSLAVKAYRTALDVLEQLPKDLLESSGRPDVIAVRRSAAYNLATLYRAQGSLELARGTLAKYITF